MHLPSKLFNLNDPGWGRGNQGQNGSGGDEPPRRPPRGGGNNQGPPDLDELWRDFNKRLGGLFGKRPRRNNPFGGGGDGGGGGPSPRGARIGVIAVAIGALLVWLASGFFIIQEGNVGVVTRFGEYKTTVPAGFQWHMPAPIEDVQVVDVAQLRTFEIGFRGNARNKVPNESLMLTDDENIVDLQFVVQYRIRPDGAGDYLFNDRDPDDAVRQAAETAMREVIGRTTMDFVLYEGRTEIASRTQALLQRIMDLYNNGILISTVAILNAQPPEQVQAAFDDAVKAGQDREREINEGEAYANSVIPRASGTASRMLEEAEGYRVRVVNDARGNAARFTQVMEAYQMAPDVTRDRLYLETMQQILAESSKVLVDAESSNNMMYLPLDRLMQESANRAGSTSQRSAESAGSQDSGSRSSSGSGSSSSTSGNSSSSSGSLSSRTFDRNSR